MVTASKIWKENTENHHLQIQGVNKQIFPIHLNNIGFIITKCTKSIKRKHVLKTHFHYYLFIQAMIAYCLVGYDLILRSIFSEWILRSRFERRRRIARVFLGRKSLGI